VPRRLALALVLTVAGGVLLAHEGHAPLPTTGVKVDAGRGHISISAAARDALDVRTAEIGTAPPPPETVLGYAGLASPWTRHAYAVSRLPGRIAALHARPGDRVTSGQVLAEVRSPELEALQLEVRTARTESQLAARVLAGMRDAPGAVPARDLLAAEVQGRQARNALDLAVLKWRALGLPAEPLDALLAGGTPAAAPALPVRSPVSGTVTHADLSVGRVIEPGEHLFEIVDLSTVWARIGVLEKDADRVAAGQEVEVRLTAYPGEPFRGTVGVVGRSLDPVTHLVDVWAEFSNPPGGEPRLLPGMTGQARVRLPAAAGTRTLPPDALVDNGVDRSVLVEEAKTAAESEYRRTSVSVVRESAGAVEVRPGGLFPGDRVVTRGSQQLGAFFVPGVLRLTPEAVRAMGLRVEPAISRVVADVAEVPAAVELPPDRRGAAATRLPGAITSIRVGPGQRVKAGDVLAEVFSLDLLNQQLDLLREHLSAELAADQLARLRTTKDAVPARRLAEAEAAAAVATDRRDTVRRRLQLVGLSAEQLDALVARREVAPALPVRASVTGAVVSFDRVIGQAVRADEPLFEVHDPSGTWVRAFVSELEMARVSVGQPARVRLVSDPGTVLEGKVARSGRVFDAADRTLSVWVEFDREPPAPPRHNQMARVTLTLGERPPALAVPLGAVVREGTRAFVFVRQGDTFERRAVELGRADDRFAEVLAGLAVGEPVAVTAAEQLNVAWASVK
jgi:cobalt-zinc-cadmium efflux system membrane fusion protein